jgi:hypothetical protein
MTVDLPPATIADQTAPTFAGPVAVLAGRPAGSPGGTPPGQLFTSSGSDLAALAKGAALGFDPSGSLP